MAIFKRNAVAITLLLTVCAVGLTAYALIQIADQRTAFIIRACNAQNQRHTATVNSLNALLARAEKKEPGRARQIAESRAPTLLLIDALAPYQNCQHVLAKST